MKKQYKNSLYKAQGCIILMFLIVLLLPVFVSSAEFDNIKSITEISKGQALIIGDKELVYNNLWEKYQPVEIKNWFGIGETLMTGAIVKHTETCGNDCSSEMEIYIANDGVLIDDITFVGGKIKDYQFYIKTGGSEWLVDDYSEQCGLVPATDLNKPYECSKVKIGSHYENDYTYKEYEIGTEVKAGTYYVKLEGTRINNEFVDWQITTQGKLLNEWAVWGQWISTFSTSGDGASNLGGVASNGSVIAVTDYTDQKIYLYDMNGNYIKNWAVEGTSTYPLGIASNGSNWFVADGINNYIYKYSFDGTYLSRCSTGMTSIIAITTNNSNMWVSRQPTDVKQFDMNCNAVGSAINTGINNPYGLAMNGSNLYILNYDALTVNEYTFDVGSTGGSFSLNVSNSNAMDMELYGGYLYVVRLQGQVFKYYWDAFSLTTNLNSPADDFTSSTKTINFNCSATVFSTTGETIKNISLWTNMSGTWVLNETQDFTGTGGITNYSIFTKNVSDGTIDWTCRAFDTSSSSAWGTNRTLTVDTGAINIVINSPTSIMNYGYVGKSENLSWTIIHDNFANVSYNYNGTNITLYGSSNSTTFTLRNPPYNLTFWANDTAGNQNSSYINWTYYIFQNNLSYNSSLIEGSNNPMIANFTITTIPTSILLNYNGINYTPSISLVGENYIASSLLTSPLVTSDTNFTFYYIFNIGGNNIYSSSFNQTITNVALTTSCAGGFPFLNITNYDEETLSQANGTIEFTLTLLSNNNQLSYLNGTATGTNLSFCVNQNLTNSYTQYNLQLRYYNVLDYMYETYNIQNSEVSSLPITIPLYFLNNTLGTSFKINYVDFNYLSYPNAIIQIQRQYLYQDNYKTVEIPKFDNNGQAVGSFNTKNIRYKLIVINNGQILDIFTDVFPVCQNLVLGTCELNLRGSESGVSQTLGDFTYSIVKNNDTLELTYVIPSGTPKTVQFITNQDSRFMNNITSCDNSLFASGGTLSCSYNKTIGDSIILTQIKVTNETTLYGAVQISEDLSGYYLLNNFFIGFILILTLALMFMSSGVMLLIISAIGLIFLSLIFLLRGFDLITLGGSIGWLIVAIIIALYKISQKEERT